MNPRCIAYREDGRICGQSASVLDLTRGGMVCVRHAPNAEPAVKRLIAYAAEASERFGDDECERHAEIIKRRERR